MLIRESLKEARKAQNLTQAAAAEKWGINLRTLQDWEYGRNEPRGFARAQLEALLAGILGDAGGKRPRS